jgi:hypothetical protein
MPTSSRALLIAGVAVVVAVGALAVFVMSGHDEARVAPPRSAPHAATDEPSDLADRIDAARTHAPAATGGEPGPAAGSSDAPRPDSNPSRRSDAAAEPPAPEVDHNDGADGQMAKLKEIAKSTAKSRVVYRMGLFTDATEDGIANRRAQALADARTLTNMYSVKGETAQAQIRSAFQDQWDLGAREIGPIVHDGLEKADIAMVRERLAGLYSETDRRLRPLFDDATWKQYEAAAAGLRKADGEILDEFEKARLRK